MPIVKLDDGTGETIRVMDVDGYPIPTFDMVFQNQEEEFRGIRHWQLRPDDIFICAYPKAGTHWLWEITSMLVNQSSDRVKLIKETSMMEGVTKQMFDNIPSSRVLNTHIPLHFMPQDTLENKTKIILVQRNPKDICVSYFHHHKKILEYEYTGTWEHYVKRFMKGQMDYGSWFDYTLEWENCMKENPNQPIHLLSYEDMKANSIKEISKLSEFLGLKTDPALVKEIADKCEFKKMKKEKDHLENKEEWRDGEPGMYRKGQVGDWKNWFTAAQSEEFDAVCKDKLKDCSFSFKYCLNEK